MCKTLAVDKCGVYGGNNSLMDGWGWGTAAAALLLANRQQVFVPSNPKVGVSSYECKWGTVKEFCWSFPAQSSIFGCSVPMPCTHRALHSQGKEKQPGGAAFCWGGPSSVVTAHSSRDKLPC